MLEVVNGDDTRVPTAIEETPYCLQTMMIIIFVRILKKKHQKR